MVKSGMVLMLVSGVAFGGIFTEDKPVTIENIKTGLMAKTNKKVCLYVDGKFNEYVFYEAGNHKRARGGMASAGKECDLRSVESAGQYINIKLDKHYEYHYKDISNYLDGIGVEYKD